MENGWKSTTDRAEFPKKAGYYLGWIRGRSLIPFEIVHFNGHAFDNAFIEAWMPPPLGPHEKAKPVEAVAASPAKPGELVSTGVMGFGQDVTNS